MFKIATLFSVLALAAAKPSVLLPLAYNTVPGVSTLAYNTVPAVSTLAYNTVPAVSSQSQYNFHGSALVPAVYGARYGLTYPSVLSGYPYSGWASHSPVVLDPINGVPLDTPEVVAARAAHLQAKALSGHHLAKRSLGLGYSPVVPSYGISPYSHGLVAPLSPLAYSGFGTPLVSNYANPWYGSYGRYANAGFLPKALSVHPY